MSEKIIIPLELLNDKNNVKIIKEILNYVNKNYNIKKDLEKIMKSFITSWLIQNNLLDKNYTSKNENITNFINKNMQIFEQLLEFELPKNENDILGIIYQCLQTEGDKNIKGSYYTPKNIIKEMIKEINKQDEIKVLDPCCGTGAFLLETNLKNPNNIYGIDVDNIATMIAKVNLMIKYKNIDFEPKIYNFNFITENAYKKIKEKFDYIITNIL